MHRSFAAVLVISCLTAAPAIAQTAGATKLKAARPEAGVRLGTEMDLTSDARRLVVAEGRRPDGDGAVHVFDWNGTTWTASQAIRASDPGPGGRLDSLFGASVAVEGDWLIVGAPEASDAAEYEGAAFLYERTPAGWVERRRFVSADRRMFRLFGSHVAIDDRTLVIGARNLSGGRREVEVYTLRNGTWTGPEFLSVPGVPAALFGAPVAVEGDRILVGSSVFPAGGSIHVFERDGGGDWIEVDRVSSPELSGIAIQGGDLALDGRRFTVTNPQRSVYGEPALSSTTRVYRKGVTTWDLEARVSDPDALPGDAFGCSVDLRNELLFVGACQDDEPSFESGALFTFVRTPTGWLQIDKRTPDELYAPLNFGEAVAYRNGVLAVTAPGDGADAVQSGAVYVFGVPGGGTPRIEAGGAP